MERGSILQKRNPKQDGVYTLKGKIKNAKKITDLSSNNEIIVHHFILYCTVSKLLGKKLDHFGIAECQKFKEKYELLHEQSQAFAKRYEQIQG